MSCSYFRKLVREEKDLNDILKSPIEKQFDNVYVLQLMFGQHITELS